VQILPVLLLTFAVERAFFEAGTSGIRTRAAVISFLCVFIAAAVGEIGGFVVIALHDPSASIREWLQIPMGTAIAGAMALVVGHATVGSGMLETIRAFGSAHDALNARRLLAAEPGHRDADTEFELGLLERWLSDSALRDRWHVGHGENVRDWAVRDPRHYLEAQAARRAAAHTTDEGPREIPPRVVGAVLLVSAVAGSVASPAFRPLGAGIATVLAFLLLLSSKRRKRLADWLRQTPDDLEARLRSDRGAEPEDRR
jgi:hypothetical protein